MTVVPSPGELLIDSAPPDCSANPLAIASPRPVPCPGGLVVKNGSLTRAQRGRVHARPIVRNAQPHIVTRHETGRMMAVLWHMLGLGRENERATIGHGVARIGAEIDDGRLQLRLVGDERWNIRRDIDGRP